MENSELANYIAQRKAAGATNDMIRHELTSAGWPESDVAAALGESAPSAAAQTPHVAEPPTIARATPSVVSAQPAAAPKSAPQAMQVPPSEFTEETVASRHSGRRWIVAGIVVILLVLVGAVGAAAAYYNGMLGSLFSPPPATLASDALSQLQAARSVSFAATSTVALAFTATTTVPWNAHLVLAEAGSWDNTASSGPDYDVTLSAQLNGSSASSTGSGALSVRAIGLGDAGYLNLENFNVQYHPADPTQSMQAQMMLGALTGMVSPLEHQWFSVTQTASTTMNASTSPALEHGIAALSSYLSGGSYIVSAVNDGSATVEGEPTYHLTLTLRIEQKFANLILNILNQAMQTPPAGVTVGGFSMATASTTAALQQIVGKQVTVELWVGKTDHRLYQSTIKPFTITENGVTMTVSVAVQQRNYGAVPPIAAPSGAQPLQSVLQNLLPFFPTTNVAAGNDAAVQSELSTIQTEAMIYHDQNGSTYGVSRSCTGSGVWTDPTIAASVRGMAISGAKPICSANGRAYVVEAPSQAAAGTYYCVDSTGTSKQTSTKIVPGRNFRCP